MMNRQTRKRLSLAALLLSALGLGLTILTPLGVRFLAFVMETRHPGLSLGEVNGSLLQGYTLQQLRYHAATADLSLDQLTLRLEPTALASGRLHVTNLELDGLNIRTAALTAGHLPDLRDIHLMLPFAWQMDRFSLQAARWQAASGPALSLNSLTARLYANPQGVNITELSLQNETLSLELAGGWHPADAQPLAFETHWQLHAAQTLEGQGRVTGDFAQLTLQQTLLKPYPAEALGSMQWGPDGPNWQARLTLPALPLQAVAARLPAWPMEATVDLTGSGQRVRMSGTGSLNVPTLGPLTLATQCDYQPGAALNISRLDVHHPESHARLTALSLIHI